MDDESRLETLLGEWQEQLDRGTAPEPEAVIAAHPELADELRGCFAALLAVRGGETHAPDLALRALAPDRYSVFRPVGKGGMGLVYWAIDNDLNREVAFKVVRAPGTAHGEPTPESPREITPPSADTPASRAFETLKQRFLQEAWVTGAMAHPGIVPVYELGQTDAGVPYYTMRFVRGEQTLADAIARVAGASFEARIPLLEPFLKVCDTIQYAHAQYVIHRDLKPENIALGQFGEVVVLDWGLAKLRGQPGRAADPWRDRLRAWREAADLDTVSAALGTPGYMAPEAVAGRIEEIDEQSDVYSLGAILFRLLTGRAALAFEDFADLAQQVLRDDPPVAREHDPTIPLALSDLCRAALAREKSDRPAGVSVLAAGIRQWQTQSQIDRQVDGWLQEARGRLTEAQDLEGGARVGALDRTLVLCGRVLDARPDSQEALALRRRVEGLRKAALEARHRAARRRLLVQIGAALLVLGSVAAVLVAGALDRRRKEAVAAREDAEANLRRARIRGLVASSAEAERADPMLALLLARFAVRQADPPPAAAVSRLYGALVSSLERARFDGHTAEVRSAVFSPAGDAVLTSSRDGTARIWSLAGGAPVVLAHDGPLWGATFSPDGRRVLVRSEREPVAYLWDRAGTLVARLAGHTDRILATDFSLSGERMLTASADGTVRIWDAMGAERAQLRGHTAAVNTAVFSAAGDTVLTASEDRSVRLWDPAGRERSKLDAPAAVWAAAYASPEGEILVSLADGTSRLWTSTGEELATYRGAGAQLSSAGDRVLTNHQQRHLYVHDRAGTLLATWNPPGGAASTYAFLPGEQRVAVASYDASVRIWDPTGVQATALLAGHTGWTEDISFSPAGDRILTACRDGTVRLWEPLGSAYVALRGHTGRIDAASFSPTGTQVLTAARDGTARLWDRDGTQRAVVPCLSWTAAVFAPAGDRFVVGLSDHAARVWDVAGQELAVLQGHTDTIESIAFSGDGQQILTASRDGTLRRWDAAGRSLAVMRRPGYRPKRAWPSPTGDRILVTWLPPRPAEFLEGFGASLLDPEGRELAELGTKVRVAAFSPDGERIVTGSYEGVVGIWDGQGRPLAEFRADESSILCCTFLPERRGVVTGSDDGTARVWDLTGRPLAVLRGHANSVLQVAVDATGTRILTGAFDQTARLWSVSGTWLATLRHEGNIAAVDFAPDGATALTASFDGAARIWPIETGLLMKTADARITRTLDPDERERYAELLGR